MSEIVNFPEFMTEFTCNIYKKIIFLILLLHRQTQNHYYF